MTGRALRLRITGRVQGVGFRDWTIGMARQCQVDGWVRNRRDRSVEAIIAGSDAAIEAMLAACHQGPPAARVDAVEVTDWTDPVAAGFRFRETD